MILTEHEVKTCLIYALQPILQKYGIQIKEAQLFIHDKIEVQAQLSYQERLLDLITAFDIDYKKNCLCFENITGKVEYLFLSLNMISVLQQLIHDDKVTFSSHHCYYHITLPIRELKIKDQKLYIGLNEK